MTTIDYLEKIDDTLAHWEDYFHGQEGTDVTEARLNLNKVRKQLILSSVSQQRELLIAYRTMIEFDVKHEDFEESVDYFLENKESYL